MFVRHQNKQRLTQTINDTQRWEFTVTSGIVVVDGDDLFPGVGKKIAIVFILRNSKFSLKSIFIYICPLMR